MGAFGALWLFRYKEYLFWTTKNGIPRDLCLKLKILEIHARTQKSQRSLPGPKNCRDPQARDHIDPKNPGDPCVDLKMLKLEIIEKIDTPARVCAQRSINIVICQTLFKTFIFQPFPFSCFKTSNLLFFCLERHKHCHLSNTF